MPRVSQVERSRIDGVCSVCLCAVGCSVLVNQVVIGSLRIIVVVGEWGLSGVLGRVGGDRRHVEKSDFEVVWVVVDLRAEVKSGRRDVPTS